MKAKPKDDIAGALANLAQAVHRLGLADAHTSMGALELLALEVRDGAAKIAAATAAVADSTESVASATRDLASAQRATAEAIEALVMQGRNL